MNDERTKQQVSMTLDIELVDELDRIAMKEKRSRSHIANDMLRKGVA